MHGWQLQIDIGFGDDVVPGPQDIELPSMLDLPVPKLRGYTRESSIAEKFSAMLELGELNSRVKDFFDIWILSRQFDFDGQPLILAISNVLSKRAIKLEFPLTAFQDHFTKNPVKDNQWKGFLRKSHLDFAPQQFCEVAALVEGFLSPVIEALHGERPFDCFWKAPGPWLPRPRCRSPSPGAGRLPGAVPLGARGAALSPPDRPPPETLAARCRDRQARHAARAAPRVCHPPLRRDQRPAGRPARPRPPRRFDDPDLHSPGRWPA
jgi:hypothetical protein